MPPWPPGQQSSVVTNPLEKVGASLGATTGPSIGKPCDHSGPSLSSHVITQDAVSQAASCTELLHTTLVHTFLLEFRFCPLTHFPVRTFLDTNKFGFRCLLECAHAYTSLQTWGLNSGPQTSVPRSLKAAGAVFNFGQIWTEFLQTPCSGYMKIKVWN